MQMHYEIKLRAVLAELAFPEFGIFASCAAFCICVPAFAAEESNIAQNAAPAELPAVIVTAERRPQPVQKVPISITAFSGDDLEEAKIGSIMEMQKLVPGLTVTQSATAHGQPFIRGIGTAIEGAGVENAVAVYVDGVYQSRAIGETMQLIDVERVEVLKGPQGVLYGRNATGGAINIISKAPNHEFSTQADVQAGSYNQQIVRGTVSGPLSEGAAYGRLSVLYNRDDGDTKNVLLNVRGNSNDIQGMRGALELMPSDKLSVLVNASYYRNDFSSTMKPLYPAVNPLFTGAYGSKATVIDDPRTIMANVASDASLTNSSIDATARWYLDSALLTLVTAFRKTDYNIRKADLDGTEIPLASVGSPVTGIGMPEISHFFSQEFTLASDNNGPLTWTGLLSYNHEKVESLGWNFSFPLLNRSTNSLATVKTDALGLGGQAIYALTDRLHITGGARYSTETKNLESLQMFVNGALTGSMSDKKTWSAVTPKFVIDYSPDRNSMYYASATKGFKSGGFNTITVQPGFDPETATSYEAGFKGKWLDGRLHTNLAAFYTHYDNMQLSVVMGGSGSLYNVIENAAKAVSKGLEAGAVFKPTKQIELSGNTQLLNARFVEFTSIDPHSPTLGPISQKGNPLLRAPDVTVNLAAQYTWPVWDGGGVLALRGEESYRSKIYFTPIRSEYASSPGVSVCNAMLSYRSLHGSGWYGSVFVKNLTNRTYASNIFDYLSLGYLGYFAPARTIGAQIGYRY